MEEFTVVKSGWIDIPERRVICPDSSLWQRLIDLYLQHSKIR
jgi:hypothetical protein